MCTLIIGCLLALAACEPDVVRPGLEPPDGPALTQNPEPVEIQVAPAGDTYVSRALPAQNFGADTLLLLNGDHRPLLRWDSAAVAQTIGNGSLLEARLELTVLSNSGGWPGNARWVALHAMSEEWVEEEASWDCSSTDPAPCDPWSMDEPEELEGPQGPYHSPWNPQATDSLRVMNNTEGVVSFDVTGDVVAALQGGVYRHGWLLKRVNESTGGTLEIGSRESDSAPRLVLTVELPEQVPFTPPDSLPSQALLDSIYAPENLVYDFRIGYVAPRNVLFVGFHSQASEQERQEAVDLVDGVVIGGMPVAPGVGLYMLRIPHDGTAELLVQALEALRSLPQVQFAHANPPPMEPSHRKPHDGTGWEAGDWNSDPDSANGANWGPEAIAAPLAWGCETGSATTRVDILDTNVGAAPHGSLVSAILGEPGDSGAQTTGIMWESSRVLHDFLDPLPPAGQRPLAMLSRLDQVVRGVHGEADIINLSLSAAYTDSITGNLRLPTPTPGDEAQARAWADYVYRMVSDARTFLDRRPLLVIAAGNFAMDAFFSGLPILADSTGINDQVLVVTASNVNWNLWTNPGDTLHPGSNHGHLVSVAAPGADLMAFAAPDPVPFQGLSGTSYAAPHVSGIAGLLRSFDPSLTTSELKDLIIAGAVAGGRTAGGIPVVNAYESLKAAARRDGAPLCGSRIAADGDSVLVQRDSGWEPLFSLDADVGRLNPHHGGRIIDVYLDNPWTFESSSHRFALVGGAWSHTGLAPSLGHHPGAPEGSIYNSMMGVSHDRDTTALALVYAVFEEAWVELRELGSPPYQTHVLPVPTGDYASEWVCTKRRTDFGSCAWEDPIVNGTDLWGRAAWVPRGGKVVIAVNRGPTVTTLAPWVACGTDRECRDFDIEKAWSETDLYEMDVLTGAWEHLFSVPFYVDELAVSEDRSEIVVARFRRDELRERRWSSGGQGTLELAAEDSQCAVEWRSYATGDVLATSPFEKATCRIRPLGSPTIQFDWFLGSLAP